MSTIDPAMTRLQSRPGLVGPVISLMFLAASWWLFGLGLGDAARYPVGALYLDAADVPPNDDPSLLWALFTGVIVGSIMGAGLQHALTRRIGVRMAMGTVTATGLAAVAIGILTGARWSWVRPETVGTLSDGTYWSIGAWVAWTSQFWAPAVLVMIAAAVLVGELQGARGRKQRRDRIDRALQHGVNAVGAVTDVQDTGVIIMNRPRVTLTVRFTDHLGVERWVTTTQTVPWTTLPRVGDAANVRFDPADPSNQETIIVSGVPTG